MRRDCGKNPILSVFTFQESHRIDCAQRIMIRPQNSLHVHHILQYHTVWHPTARLLRIIIWRQISLRVHRSLQCQYRLTPYRAIAIEYAPLNSYVSFAQEPYKRDYILLKRPMILRSLLTRNRYRTPTAAPTVKQFELWRTGRQFFCKSREILTPYLQLLSIARQCLAAPQLLIINVNDWSKGVGILENRRATHCNTLQHTATHCNTLQHINVNDWSKGVGILGVKIAKIISE